MFVHKHIYIYVVDVQYIILSVRCFIGIPWRKSEASGDEAAVTAVEADTEAAGA